SMTLHVKSNDKLRRDHFLRDLVRIQYRRKDFDFHRGTFRVRGDLVEVHPAYEENRVIRIEFFGDFVEKVAWVDPLTGEKLEDLDEVKIYPGSHYVTGEERIKSAIETIREELRDRLNQLKD